MTRMSVQRCLLILFTAGCLTGPLGATESQVIRYEDGQGGQMWYRIYLPENFDPSRSYPITTFLHGNDGTNIRPVVTPEVDVEVPPAGLISALRSGPYESILIAPQLERGSFSDFGNDRLIREAVESVEATYGTDPTRRYLTGLSFGGFGSFHLAGEFPDFWAAAVPIAGGHFPRFDPLLPLPDDPWAEYVEAVQHLPIWAFHGAQDNVVSVEATRQVIRPLQAAEANTRYSELPRGGHPIWEQIYDVNDFPPTAVFRIDADTASKTFELTVTVDKTQSLGLHRYSVDLEGVESVENVGPMAEFTPASGGAAGFSMVRSGNDQLPVRGLQSSNFLDGSMIEGVAQRDGVIPGAAEGTGVIQPMFDESLLIATGSYDLLELLDFSDEISVRNLLAANASVIPLNRGRTFPFAVAYTELYHDGQLIYSRGDHEQMYPWLFRQRRVPEPSGAALIFCLAGLLSAVRRRMPKDVVDPR